MASEAYWIPKLKKKWIAKMDTWKSIKFYSNLEEHVVYDIPIFEIAELSPQ